MLIDWSKKSIQKILHQFGLKLEKVGFERDPYLDMQKLLSSITVNGIVDGGAYHGIISKKLLSIFPKSKIYAFEPQKDIYSILQTNVSSYKNIIAINYAISSNSGKKKLYINEKRDTSSLKPISSYGRKILTHVIPSNVEIVNVITLDQWAEDSNISDIDIIKLDLQGHELEALKGSIKLIESSVKLIYTEVEFVTLYEDNCLFFDIEDFLRNKGFNLYQFYHLKSGTDGRLLWGDVIYVKNEFLD